MTATAVRTPLTDLVTRIRAVVSRGLSEGETAFEVANYLRPTLTVPGLLTDEQRQGSVDGYTQHVLHVEPDGAFSVVALVWLPGQATPVAYPPVDPDTRKRLIEHFKPHNDRLAVWLGRDLSAWDRP